jgi:hypothetical protein
MTRPCTSKKKGIIEVAEFSFNEPKVSENYFEFPAQDVMFSVFQNHKKPCKGKK